VASLFVEFFQKLTICSMHFSSRVLAIYVVFGVDPREFHGQAAGLRKLVLSLHDGAFIMNVGALSLKNRDFGIWWPSHQIPVAEATGLLARRQNIAV
jgi:hypothetical protein